MNRRKLLYNLMSVSAANLATPSLFSLELNRWVSPEHGDDESSSIDRKYSPYRPLRVGLLGVVGAGVCFLNRVAEQLNYPCKTVAIETNANRDRLRWCCPDNSLLIGAQDEIPATVTDAQRMGHDQGPEIAQLVSGLDVAFLLTGLNGISGKGLAIAVADTLGESGVFTVAVVLGRREPEAVDALRQLVDATTEIPYPWQAAPGGPGSPWREQYGAVVAQKIRVSAPPYTRHDWSEYEVSGRAIPYRVE